MLTQKDWLLGTYDGLDNQAKNFIAMEINRYVQITNWKQEDLSLREFKSRLRATENIERRIATKKNKLGKHDQKWSTILRLLN